MKVQGEKGKTFLFKHIGYMFLSFASVSTTTLKFNHRNNGKEHNKLISTKQHRIIWKERAKSII